ncbi:hypothetical protein HYH03_003597 [Edaphochlamys debaryana]|uniref:Uncharacterized protein n=1 Tax=Edaphochlamys debaryana TaxID=47281 RepID=A0A835YBR0_9CHLO|nr:hypothetical protein HYH03_003597 [Edaphochlamys debaryana]|eukprot:KAG2498338.1 hypothetical protein HYH03_003597 [Edaphochlamys debaryana]
MAPKPKKPEAPPPPPPEPSPDDALPPEIKELTECPFAVTWRPVVSIVDFAPGTDAKGISTTLKRKDAVRHVSLMDAVLRLDASTALGAEAKPILDAHLAAGNGPETCVFPAPLAAKLMAERFTRDERADWRVELHSRRSRLASAQDEATAAENALTAAQAAVVAATEALAAYNRAVEEEIARKLAEEEAQLEEEGGAPPPPPPPPPAPVEEEGSEGADSMVEKAQEEVALEEAQARVVEAQAKVRETAEALARTAGVQLDPFVCYQSYTLSGMELSLDAIRTALDAGAPLRSVVWARPPPPAAPPVDSGASDAPSTAGAGGAAAPPAAPTPAGWWSDVRAAAAKALWDDVMARIVSLEVEVPAYVPPAPEVPEKGKKPPSAKPAAKAKTGKEAKEAAAAAAAAAEAAAAAAAAAPPAEVDAPGFEELTAAVLKLAKNVRTYDEWRASVKVYDDKQLDPPALPPPPVPPGPPPTPQALPTGTGVAAIAQAAQIKAANEKAAVDHAEKEAAYAAAVIEYEELQRAAALKEPPKTLGYYGALLDGVPLERVSIPLVMHALLEQVARNMASAELEENLTETGHVAAAETAALAALESALCGLDDSRQAAIFTPHPEPPVDYSLVCEGDALAAAAAGLTTGFVRAMPPRPASPTSPLDAAGMPGSAAGSTYGGGEGSFYGSDAAAPYVGYGKGPEGLFTHSGTLDVEAVEAHMIRCMLLPGANAFADAAAAANDVAAAASGAFAMGTGLDPLSKSLRRTALQAEASELPVATIERYQLLQAAADLLPPSAKLAHEDAILSRHWHEPLDPPALKQALAEAASELPTLSASYYGPGDSVVVACFAGENVGSKTTGLPVAMNLSLFVERAMQADPGPLDLPGKVYKMDAAMSDLADSHRRTSYLYTQSSCIISAPMPAVPQATAATSVHPGVSTAATVAAAEQEGEVLPCGSVSVTRGGTTVRFKEGILNANAANAAADAAAPPPIEQPMLLATLAGGTVISGFHVVDPIPEQVAAAADAAAADGAGEGGEAKPDGEGEGDEEEDESRASTPPAKPMMSAAEALKAGNRGMFEDEDEEEEEDEPEETLEDLLNKDKEPPPVTALQVTTPSGHLIRMTTDGQVLVAPADDPSLAPLPPFRGVEVHGAPLPGANLSALRAKVTGGGVPATPLAFRAVTRDGLLVSAAQGAVERVLCPDGSVSERLDSVDGWLTADGDAPARGWRRTDLDGSRLREPDEGSKLAPIPEPELEITAPPAAAEPEPAKKPTPGSAKGSQGKKDSAKGKGKKGAEEPTPPPTPPEKKRPPPPPPPPFTLELPRIGSATLTDPDTGARVTTREDNVMVVAYPTGDILVQDYDGTRLSRLANGSWSVEMDGFAPVLGSASGISISPCPGVTLTWDAATGVVTATLPDGGCLYAAPHATAFAPAGLPPPPLTALAAAPPGEEKKPVTAGQAVRAALEAANLMDEMSNTPELTGVFLFDPRGGTSAYYESDALRFFLPGPTARAAAAAKARKAAAANGGASSAGGSGSRGDDDDDWDDDEDSEGRDSVDVPEPYWPPPEPLLSVYFPIPPPPPPPPPPPKEDEEEEPVSPSQRPSMAGVDPDDDPDARRRSGTADGGMEGGVESDDDKPPPPPPRPPTPPPPEPVITYLPVARTVKPRIFVIRNDGTGYEVLDDEIARAYMEGRRALAMQSSSRPGSAPRIMGALPVPEYGLAVDIRSEELGGAEEDGTVVHSVLVQVPQRPPALDPLPLGGAVLLQKYNPHAEELMPAFKRLAALMKPPPGAGMSSVQYLPRVMGYEPPAVRQPAPLPVLLYRELLELPPLSQEAISNIREVLLNQTRTEQTQERLYAASVPLPDTRPASVRQADADVLAAILELRSKPPVNRAKSVAAEVRRRREASEAAAVAREQIAREREAALAMAAEKEKRPWPIKVGPFDNTPKRPEDGKSLNYFEAEEGLLALENDPIIREPINRRMLPPRLPPPAATPGAPSTYSPGVYVAPRPAPDADAAAAAAAAEYAALGAAMTGNQAGAAAANAAAATAAALTARTAATTAAGRGKEQGVDYTYPELAHSQILAGKNYSPPSVKTHAYDVYGQPRTLPPPLPRQHRVPEADVALNEPYLRAEADAVRLGKTASTSLIRHAGKALKQFTLTPGHLHFGNVPYGAVTHRTARLTNVSAGAARFSVVRPELPLRVIYKPGPLAAGMETILTVEFVAETVGDFVGEVQVKSELNVLTITVSAKVLPPDPHDDDAAASASAPSATAAAGEGQGRGTDAGDGGPLPPVTSSRRTASQSSRLSSPLQGAARSGGSATGGAAAGGLELPHLDETRTLDQVLGHASANAGAPPAGEGSFSAEAPPP